MKSAHFSRRRFLSRACMLGAGSICLAGGGLPFACLEAVAGNGATERQTRLLMGTFVTLAAIGEPGKVRDAFGLAFAEMERLITVFDRPDPASALSVLNSQGRLQSSPAERYACLFYPSDAPAHLPSVDLVGLCVLSK